MTCYPSGITGHVMYGCGKYEDNLDHLLFQWSFLARAWNLLVRKLFVRNLLDDLF